jgi:ribosomal protein S21
MRKRKNFRKRPKDDRKGLSVTVFNNNVEGALKVFKRKVKDSNLMLDLKKKAYYEKPSKKRRERKNMAKLRNHYKTLKEKQNNH